MGAGEPAGDMLEPKPPKEGPLAFEMMEDFFGAPPALKVRFKPALLGGAAIEGFAAKIGGASDA